MAQDNGQWWVLVKTEINFRVPQNGGKFLDQLSDYEFLKKNCA
jgi:hypothetical protein